MKEERIFLEIQDVKLTRKTVDGKGIEKKDEIRFKELLFYWNRWIQIVSYNFNYKIKNFN